MKLFLDIDDTVLKSLPYPEGSYPPRIENVRPDTTLELPGYYYDVYLRPDLDVLAGRPFSLFTSGSSLYASSVASFLDERGFRISGVYSREDMCEPDEACKPITYDASVLIDDLPSFMAGVAYKLARLPGAFHCRVDGYSIVMKPDPSHQATSGFAPRYLKYLEFVHHDDSTPLGECLKRIEC